MKSAILGKKVGMTCIYDAQGVATPVTVIEAGPCKVVSIRTHERDGYSAIQLGFGSIRENLVNRPEAGHFKKAGIAPVRHLKEFRNLEKDYVVGADVTVEEFNVGDKVKISGTSKGRGFQGVVKRHHFAGVGMQTHGQSDRQRHPGSIGSSSYPSRVFKGMKMGGRMGGKQISIRNVQIYDILPERNIILLKGSVPGPKNTLLEIVKV